MNKIVSIKDDELLQQIVKILSNHCGETGENEGAVQTLNRIIEDAEKWNKLDSMITGGLTELKNDHEIVQQLRKLLGNTTKNPEHCCQAFEYLRDGLQKAMEEKD